MLHCYNIAEKEYESQTTLFGIIPDRDLGRTEFRRNLQRHIVRRES